MKKIMGVVVGASFLSAMAYTAFAADLFLQTTLSDTSGTINTTASTDSGTTNTTTSSSGTETTVSADTAPVQTTQVTTSTTDTASTEPTTSLVPTPQIAPTTVHLAPLTAYTVLDGNSRVISGTRNIFIKTSREIYSAEVVLVRNGVTEHLGQAQPDSVNKRWVYVWDSKMRTQDGSYRLFSIVKSADGVTARSTPIDVSVKNEKSEEATVSNIPSGIVSTTTSAISKQEYFRKKEEEKQRNLKLAQEELAQNAQKLERNAIQQGGTQPAPAQTVLPKTGLVGTFSRPIKPTPVDFEKVINEKSLELKDAVERGDANKRAAVVAEIVRVARGSDEITPPGTVDPLAQKVEESVRKLEQVIIEQEHGVVDEKTFKVEAVQVAEVTTKPDGTQAASKIAFRGKALPDSFVTLYIFSLPIVVTVKTDADGNWNYTLDKELEDGNHQVYVGITDVKGKVVVKSNPLPFVKTASAITVEEALAVPQAQAAPSFVENNYFYGIVTIIIMFVAYIFIFLGIKMSKTSE